MLTKPAVVSRQEWGCPTGANSPDWTPQYTTVTHLIVHHTATPNDDPDWKARVRSIWNFHAITRDGKDIAYNYLIDPDGVIYEGRAGGDNVIGRHATGANKNSMGVALIGNFDQDLLPTEEALDSLIKLLAWKAEQAGIDPTGSSHHSEVGRVLPNVCGHRDVGATACPGRKLYALLPRLRIDVSNLIQGIDGEDEVVPSGDYVPQPPIVSRAEWGCPTGAESPGWKPRKIPVSHMIIHHTATRSNAKVSTIWNYHANTLGWKDIGYNYLIDPDGVIYEGRAGGEDVMGAHAYDYNHHSMGVSLIGNFESAAPTQKALDSLTQLLAWKAAKLRLDPMGKDQFGTTPTNLMVISGHRDVNATACPGREMYALLPDIRSDVNDIIKDKCR